MEQSEEKKLVTLSEEDIKRLIKEGIREYKKDEAKGKQKDRYHDTFQLMKIYRDAAIHIHESISEADQLAMQGMTGRQKDIYIKSIRESKIRSMIMEAHIDRMLKELKERRTQTEREYEYKAFEMYFLQGKTYEQIAEELNCGSSSPRRWTSGVLRELSPLLWGYDSVLNNP